VNLRKVYERAEKERGVRTGSFIDPVHTFTPEQLQYKVTERDVQTAVGSLAMFDKAKGAIRSISDIFNNTPLDATGKVSVDNFLAFCEPLAMFQASNDVQEANRHQSWLGSQSMPGYGAKPKFPAAPAAAPKRRGGGKVIGLSDLPSGTKNKLKLLLGQCDPVYRDAAFVGGAGPEAALDPVELKYAFVPADFGRLLREHSLYPKLATEERTWTIDEVVQHLDTGVGTIALSAFMALFKTQAHSPTKAETKKERKRFNTWGRKKKAKNVDSDLGIYADEDASGSLESRKANFMY